MSGFPFSWSRFVAVVVKEFVQMRRDRLTFAMMIGVPIMQLLLFGYAINADPKQLPTAVIAADQGRPGRSIVSAMENSGYFRIDREAAGDAEADAMLDRGDVLFVVTIPTGFERDLARGERPSLLVEADATDPGATAGALGALGTIATTALTHDMAPGATGKAAPFDVVVHRRYNPEGITQYNIVPGLIGVILTMTMVIMTALAVTRERERGTMENLLAMPVRPGEVMIGKITPYILVGLVQVTLVVIAARLLFGVPLLGSVGTLAAGVTLFIAANLAIGFTFSTIARNQLQAMQMSVFFFLPSILLSGFMFPFLGMPRWAQVIGEALPLTHFMRLVRGVMLKGNDLVDMWQHLWPLMLVLTVVTAFALKRYRQTLD